MMHAYSAHDGHSALTKLADGEEFWPTVATRHFTSIGSPEHLAMMRRRKIWSEGSFAVLKREHLLSTIRKHGILNACKECLLSALALNPKRMAEAICFASFGPFVTIHDEVALQKTLFFNKSLIVPYHVVRIVSAF